MFSLLLLGVLLLRMLLVELMMIVLVELVWVVCDGEPRRVFMSNKLDLILCDHLLSLRMLDYCSVAVRYLLFSTLPLRVFTRIEIGKASIISTNFA